MKLLEYEAKDLLRRTSISVPASYNATPEPSFLPAVLKSQVPVGGRGKAGGVKVVETPEDYTAAFQTILDLPIKGFMPKTVLAEELLAIEKEFYLSLLVDKSAGTIVIMAHRDGGVEIESHSADSFFTKTLTGDNDEAVGELLAEYFDLPEKSFVLQDLIKSLSSCFVSNDAVLLEINPLVLTTTGSIIAGDCKMELDDAAAFRHPEWSFEETIAETNFVTLDEEGSVATIANGAGLAMATVDAVANAGMKPANFLDIGGGANEASIFAAFERIMLYKNVSVIIINIFAGITRCDEVAKAIIAARDRIENLPPLSIRLAGTNFEQAVELLSQHDIITLATLDECIKAAKELQS
jgi:succinyl-CoA synthetase beta subunit